MKKTISITLLVLVLLSCLTGCNFNQTITGGLANNAESTPKVEKMMVALAENDLSAAESLMHPQAIGKAKAAIEQMAEYLDGRKTSSIELININVSSSIGTSGNVKQEQVGYKATLTDGSVIYINAVHRSNKDGNGFVSFQLVLGLV